MTIPHITIEQAKAFSGENDAARIATIFNQGIDAYNEKQAQQESKYITAEQARELGAGNAEFHKPVPAYQSLNEWDVVGYTHQYSHHNKYRPIKQAPPVPVDPHAALRAEYAKQVKEGTTGFYLWEFKNGMTTTWTAVNDGLGMFYSINQYRCTDISCMVALKGEPAVRMLRTEAQELQRELGDTVEWSLCGITFLWEGDVFTFEANRTYTYAPKALKQVSWSDMPQFVKVQHKTTKQTFTFLGVDKFGYLEVFRRDCGDYSYNPPALELVPASEQPWIAVNGKFNKVEGLIYETKADAGCGTSDRDIACFKITGIAKGYVLESK